MKTKTFDICLALIKSSVPSKLATNEKLDPIFRIMAYSLMKSYEQVANLDNVYNVDEVDEELLPRLADTLSLVYPLGADPKRLRLLLKYYQKIKKRRGTLDSIKQMVRILESDEETICNGSLFDYTDIEIQKIRKGSIIIKYDNITDIEFTKEMLRKVVKAGTEVIVSNKYGPVKYEIESASCSDTTEVHLYLSDDSISDESIEGRDYICIDDSTVIESCGVS